MNGSRHEHDMVMQRKRSHHDCILSMFDIDGVLKNDSEIVIIVLSLTYVCKVLQNMVCLTISNCSFIILFSLYTQAGNQT